MGGNSQLLANGNMVLDPTRGIVCVGGVLDANGCQLSVPGVITGSTIRLSNSGSAGQLLLTGANTFTGIATIASSASAPVVINSIANDDGTPSALGAPATKANGTITMGSGGNGYLKYIGTGHSSDRKFSLVKAGQTLDASGSGTLAFTSTDSDWVYGNGFYLALADQDQRRRAADQ